MLGDDSRLPGACRGRGAFVVASRRSPVAGQVVLHTPGKLRRGHGGEVTVRLTRSGNKTLSVVWLALQLPQNWTVTAVGSTVFHNGS